MGQAEENWRFEVGEADGGQRLDRFLPVAANRLGKEVSRSALQSWIKSGAVTVNGKTVKPRHMVEAQDLVLVAVPAEEERVMKPEAMDLVVLYEDDDLIVVDKAHGVVVHPGSGNDSGTLVHGLLHRTEGRLSRLADEDRPGIVHRLDKDTSGCLVAAKSDVAYQSLVGQFSERETRKEYLAVCQGVPREANGEIRTQIGRHPVHRQRMAVVEPPSGKVAATDYSIVFQDPEGEWSTLSCLIHTGRTHQIRVHLREVLGSAVLGDPIYGPRKQSKVKVNRLMLHAWRLEVSHPTSGERLSFESAIPPEFLPFVPDEGIT